MSLLDVPSRLSIARERLAQCKLPEGPFDPTSRWENRYAAWCLSRTESPTLLKDGGDPYTKYYHSWGGLKIGRQPTNNGGRIDLVFWDTLLDKHRKKEVARIDCRDDALSTPRSWHLTATMIGRDMQPVPFLPEQKHSGQWSEGRLRYSGPVKQIDIESAASLTTLWSLFDAVQRLPENVAAIGPFDCSEDLRMVKPGQTLSPLGRETIQLVTGETEVEGFVLTGPGMMPWEFWRGPDGRLLLAASGIRFFLLDLDDAHARRL